MEPRPDWIVNKQRIRVLVSCLYFPSAVLGLMAATRVVEGGGRGEDTCRGHVSEAGLDTASTAAHMDPLELPALARLRLALQEHRERLLPGALILGGSLTTIVSVGPAVNEPSRSFALLI